MIESAARNWFVGVGLLAIGAAVGAALPAYAKPKEIVVVGSKIKETVADAGLQTGPGLEKAVSDAVYRELRDARRRAAANHRELITPYDLNDPACGDAFPTTRELVVDGDLIKRWLLKRGFEVGDEVIHALSDKVYLLLEDAVRRARLNARQVTLIQDL